MDIIHTGQNGTSITIITINYWDMTSTARPNYTYSSRTLNIPHIQSNYRHYRPFHEPRQYQQWGDGVGQVAVAPFKDSICLNDYVECIHTPIHAPDIWDTPRRHPFPDHCARCAYVSPYLYQFHIYDIRSICKRPYTAFTRTVNPSSPRPDMM